MTPPDNAAPDVALDLLETGPDLDVIARQITAAKRKLKKGVPSKVDLANAMVSLSITDTIKGSSTLTLTMKDDDWSLMDSGFFDNDENGRLDAIDINYPNRSRFWWRITQVSPSANQMIEIVLMERQAISLMAHRGPVKASRAKKTRAEFLKSLADKVKAYGGVQFKSVDLHVRQTIDAPSTTGPGAASGNVLSEGDSLAVGTEGKLTTSGGKVSTRAAVGRTSSQGVADLEDASLPATLVVQLGTNDTDVSTFRANVKKVLGMGGVKRVFWVNISRPVLGGTTDTELNAVLEDEAKGSAKLDIVDWEGAVSSGKATMSGDNIHPTAAGYEYRAKLINAALKGPSSASSFAPDETKKAAKSTDDKEADKDQGISSDEKLKIKGQKATKDQLDQAERALGVAQDLGASDRAVVAMVCAGIGESSFKAVMNAGGSPYGGVFQGNVRSGLWEIDDTEGMARAFLKGGKGFQGGGAIKLANDHADWGPGLIAVTVEGSRSNFSSDDQAENFYGKYKVEAERIIEAYGGAGFGEGSGGSTYTKQYNFAVGSPENPRETYWDAMNRLADEVKWALFFDGNRLYYDPETTLIKQKPAAVIGRDDPEVVDWSYTWDARHIATEMTLDLICDPFQYRAGQVFKLDNFGPASTGSTATPKLPGRWLIAEIERDRSALSSSFTLKQPDKPGPEPASEVGTRDDAASTSASGEGDLYAACKQISDEGHTYPHPDTHHGPFSGFTKDTPLDCSESSYYALHLAGFYDGSQAEVSGTAAATYGSPGRGDEWSVYANAGHMFIQSEGSGRKWRFDTGGHPGISGPRLLDEHRSTAGFTARHKSSSSKSAKKDTKK